jgi:molybdopterin molybdotransferase
MIHSFEQALELILQHATLLSAEVVTLEHLVGRVAAEDVSAPWDMPRWDNSEMDGFAVRAEDCSIGAELNVIGYIPAGISAEGVEVVPGSAVRIMTGAPIPSGCDAIVPIENTTPNDDNVQIDQPVTQGDYIRARGWDMVADELMIQGGTLLRPAEVSLLASFSCQQLKVYRRPQVAILSTGDELVAPGQEVGDGQIIDSNSYSMAAAVKDLGAEPILLGIAADNEESLKEKIEAGLKADVLISSAGVSAGDRDLVRDVLDQAGVEQLFWKVGMKPGGPTAFGVKGKTLAFSLPGNPVSSMISFSQLVAPALLQMMGHERVLPALVKVRLAAPLVNDTPKRRFLRVLVTETAEGLVCGSAGNQNTGVLKTMLNANAIAVLPPECAKLDVGSEIEVQLMNPESFMRGKV